MSRDRLSRHHVLCAPQAKHEQALSDTESIHTADWRDGAGSDDIEALLVRPSVMERVRAARTAGSGHSELSAPLLGGDYLAGSGAGAGGGLPRGRSQGHLRRPSSGGGSGGAGSAPAGGHRRYASSGGGSAGSGGGRRGASGHRQLLGTSRFSVDAANAAVAAAAADAEAATAAAGSSASVAGSAAAGQAGEAAAKVAGAAVPLPLPLSALEPSALPAAAGEGFQPAQEQRSQPHGGPQAAGREEPSPFAAAASAEDGSAAAAAPTTAGGGAAAGGEIESGPDADLEVLSTSYGGYPPCSSVVLSGAPSLAAATRELRHLSSITRGGWIPAAPHTVGAAYSQRRQAAACPVLIFDERFTWL